MQALLWAVILTMPAVASAPPPGPGARDGPQAATIRVALPADAKLTIDGQPTKSTSAIRSFVTPPLKPGTKYHLTFKAEFVRGNKTVTVAQDVPLWAGQETDVSLYVPGQAGLTETRSYYFAPESSEADRTETRYFYFPPGDLGAVSFLGSNRVSSGRPSWDFPAPKPLSEFSSMKGYGPPGFDYGYNP